MTEGLTLNATGVAETTPDEWRVQIERVMAGEGLNLAVQPIVDLAHGVTAGFEVLSRFDGPPRATPDVWFAKAETLGLGAALEATVIKRALDLRDDLPSGCFLSINLDPLHLDDERVRRVLTTAGSLHRVVVELTEHSVIDDYAGILNHLTVLRDAGAKIAIDDAGSGYAGLQWLMSLSPDMVKLDRALVDRIDGDEVKIALVAMLGAFADRIDAWLLAEGLERRAELDTAVRLGIPLGQGYLLSRPSLERWPEIDPDLQAHMLRPEIQVVQEGGIGQLIEGVATRHFSGPANPGVDIIVVVDDDKRPVAIDLPQRPGAAVLCVRSGESLSATLSRAMTRPIELRWTPLVCVNDLREVTGIVRLERLVETLMTHVDSHPPQTHDH